MSPYNIGLKKYYQILKENSRVFFLFHREKQIKTTSATRPSCFSHENNFTLHTPNSKILIKLEYPKEANNCPLVKFDENFFEKIFFQKYFFPKHFRKKVFPPCKM